MYAYIKGKLVELFEESLVIETAAGLAYELNVGPNTVARLRRDKESNNTLSQLAVADGVESSRPAAGQQDNMIIYTSLIVREDAHLLYGFLERKQKQLFELLLTIPRIGAKLASAICDNLSAEDLALAVMQDNPKRLTHIKGLGQKVAQRLLIDLKDKMQKLQAVGMLQQSEGPDATTPPAAVDAAADNAETFSKSEQYQDLLSALMVLGFSLPESKRMLKRSFNEALSLEENLKAALQAK